VQAYALEEMVAEKLRALAGQRKYAVARDLYDLWSLNKTSVRMDHALEAFPRKCIARGLNPTLQDVERLLGYQDEYEANWKNNLEHLVPANLKCPFADAWEVSLSLLRKALQP
jgi:predicted nucleotidyltransferase component of viral defense system